jgi:catechol 2,3-dioxygenase-like lactoylglutathione lyase family enzyme
MFKELFATCLLVDDFDISLDFYQNKLGLELNSTNSKFADFKLNSASLAIFQKNEARTMFPERYMQVGGGIILAFQVDNIEKSCSILASKGIKIFEGPKTTTWGQKVAYFLDPDKNIWEISEK